MEFSLDPGSAQYQIKSYHECSVNVNGQEYNESLIIMPEKLILKFPVGSLEEFTSEHVQMFKDLKPEMVIIGVGSDTKPLNKVLFAPLLESGIGVDVMSVHSACRTYTILMSEGRRVLAVMILT